MYNLKVNFFDFIPKTFFKLHQYEKKIRETGDSNYLMPSHPLLYDKLRLLLVYKKLIKKKKIFIQQHGGNYQDFPRKLSISLITILENSLGKTIYWGKAFKKKIYLPTPQIKKIAVNYASKKILFLSTFNFYFYYYLDYSYRYDNCMKRIELTLDLLKSLTKSIREKIYYKDHVFHFSEKELIKKKFSEINFINIAPDKLLHNFRLVILNNYSTMFYKCLGGNIPTILVNNNLRDLDKKSKKIFKRLEEKNIIFYDPIKAANFINKNYDKIFSWWSQKDVQNTVKIFNSNYCCIKKNWFDDWYNFFKNNK